MKQMKIIIIIVAIFVCGLYLTGGVNSLIPAKKSTAGPNRPDITSVIDSITTSIKKRKQLLIMTVEFQATGTSKLGSMGMTAQQTDIATGEAQYYVDLTKLSKDDFKVSGDKILLTLSKDLLVTRLLPPVRKETYNNGSWLFTFSDNTAAQLTRKNQALIMADFSQKAKNAEENTTVTAATALEELFQPLLHASGSPHKLEVVFS